MKRKLAWLLIVALLLMLFPVVTNAMEEGEMLLTSESVQGAVGDIVKVDFYCYPNLDEGLVMDSFEGTLDYDPEMLTLGSINLRDEEQNLNSLMNSKSPLWIPSKSEAGKLAFAYADAFGTDANGFLFQLEFRIEKEGACEFVFNGIRYHAIDASSYRSVGSFYINPVQIGGVYTEGYEITENGTPAATYDPLEPAVETQRPQATDTPKPSPTAGTVDHRNAGQRACHTETAGDLDADEHAFRRDDCADGDGNRSARDRRSERHGRDDGTRCRDAGARHGNGRNRCARRGSDRGTGRNDRDAETDGGAREYGSESGAAAEPRACDRGDRRHRRRDSACNSRHHSDSDSQ